MVAFDMVQNSYGCYPAQSVDIFRYSSNTGLKSSDYYLST